MMRRVSSRPRLVSDADKAFQNATVERDDSDDGYDGGYGHGLSFDDGDAHCYDNENARDSGECAHHRHVHAIGGHQGHQHQCENAHMMMMCAAAKSPAYSSAGGSTDDLSDYLSCNDLTCHDKSPSSSDLRDSFDFEKKTSPSDGTKAFFLFGHPNPDIVPYEEDGGEKKKQPSSSSLALAVDTASSAKRKRLSQHYMTPKSSYASLANMNNNTGPYHHQQPALAANSSSPLTRNRPRDPKEASLFSLSSLPEENLLCIASCLPLQDVRTLAIACRSVRASLVASQGAAQSIWMDAMSESFPTVLPGGCVTLVDDYHLAIPALCDDSLEDDAMSDKINLPLLTGLLPSRYPQAIDVKTLFYPGRAFEENAPRARAFRSGILETSSGNNGNALSGAEEDSREEVAQKAVLHQSMPVVQFMGNVGNGDRCIRSDRAFPPNPIKVSFFDCDSTRLCEPGSPPSSGSGFGRGLSSWMKSHSLRRSGRKSRSSGSSSRRTNAANESQPGRSESRSQARAAAFRGNSSFSSASSFHHGYMVYQPSAAIPASLLMPRQHSPISRFLSSLSHHCTSPVSSSNSSRRSSYMDEVNTGDITEDRATGEGINNYGMIKQELVSKCKQSLGKLRNNLKYVDSNGDGLRPFVIPTVVSDTSNDNGEHSLVVDVTPRLVAYFEVTIVKQEGQVSWQEHNTDEAPRTRATRIPSLHFQNAITHLQQMNNNLGTRPQQAAPLLRHTALEEGVLDNIHGLEGRALRVLGELDRLMREVRLAEAVNRQQQNNIRQQQPRNGRAPRHECVAVGLSTGRFNPHDKMPGWDHESWGYHGDDGGSFHGRGDMLHQYGPSFGPGDTIGCGLEYSSRKIFFTKNGEFLGYAFDGESVTREIVESGLYPTVGVDTECPIFMNFGEKPFGFDLRGFAASVTTESHAE